MIVVTVELWPKGDPNRSRRLGNLRIWNEDDGDTELANYSYTLETVPTGSASGRVVGHKPIHGFWKLLYSVLCQFYPYEES